MRRLSLLLALAAVALAEDEDDVDCTLTQHGGPSGPGVKCVFPFVLFEETFDMCTTATEGDDRPWCPTRTDENGTYFLDSRDWGYCDPRCPFIDKFMERMNSTTPKPTVTKFRRRSTTTAPPVTVPTTTTTTTTTPSQSTSESTPSAEPVSDDDSNLGTWRPNPDLGECGFSVSVGYIIGGERAKRGQFPFVALLAYVTNTTETEAKIEYRCGGTLINKRYVVTAAHCHRSTAGHHVSEVLLGEYDVSLDPDCQGCRGVQRVAPETVTVHEGYSDLTGANDIALIRLSQPAVTILDDIESVVLPACLDLSKHPEAMASLRVAGWGKTTNLPLSEIVDFVKLGISERTLNTLIIPYVEFKRCKAFFTKITPNQFCAGGEEGKDSCNGDSGGPVIGQETTDGPMYLVGVVSSGTSECGIGQAGIYTRMSEYDDWLKKHLKP